MSAPWATAKAPDGRTYYYRDGVTTWEKPADFDEAGPAGEWKEAQSADGKTYYWNTVTKKTSWQRPDGVVSQEQSAPALVAGGGHSYGGDDRGHSDRRMERRGDRDHILPSKPSFDGGRGGGMPWEQRQDHGGFRGAAPVKTDEPDYTTVEQAEEAFFNVLRKHKVSPSTQWEDALRMVIQERDYRALRNPMERRAAFEKYCMDVRAQEKSKEKERRAKMREDYLKMLTTHEDIKHYTRWKTARPMLEREVAFRAADDEDERRQLFDEYIGRLKKEHAGSEIEQQRMAARQLSYLLENNVKDADARWDDVAPALMEQPGINKLDAVNAFENHMKSLERDINATKQIEKRSQFRSQRQARDGFKGLLHEMQSKGTIKAGTRWADVYSLISEDPRFLNVVGVSGSSPLELFWDLLEEEDRKIRSLSNDAMDVLDAKRYEITLSTSVDEFADVMRSDPRTGHWSSDQIALVFERLRASVKKRKDESRGVDDRSRRRAIDDLRSAIKSLEPPVRVGDSYEDVMSMLSSFKEYKALDDEARKTAFDKHMNRLKEKEQDRHRDSHRERERDRDRHPRRERDREQRPRTRTPEIDAYEADRRKAQEARERHYRKPSFGLTPPPRERRDDRDDRYRRHDRVGSGMSVYDEERRAREHERERSYVSRADPRDKGRALDYGDEDAVGSGSRPGSIRKRRESEGSAATGGRRDAKRSRRGGQTPESVEQTKEDADAPALQSGSEEGEIEEV